VATPSDDLTGRLSTTSSHRTGGGIVIDIGTGDGRFVYQNARRNPDKFYIGIDPSPRPLAKISEKIHRRPKKGGLANVLFIQAAVEDLPSELDAVADELHVHFPWGGLLKAVAIGDGVVLGNLRRMCASDALLEVIIGIDADRDRSEIERLGLQELSISFLDSVLAPRYRAAGFEVLERGELPSSEWPSLRTTWAERLRRSASRSIIYIIARASL
jgi:16S rRNA (adenine(1408)-N(1))-methyltransferase